MVKPLPPLNAIRAFEVASRHLNLSPPLRNWA